MKKYLKKRISSFPVMIVVSEEISGKTLGGIYIVLIGLLGI
jgi:hypothetical protein